MMKICPVCNTRFNSLSWHCLHCGKTPNYNNGLLSFASPDRDAGFKPEFFAQLAALEEKYFWFQARNRLISWVLNKYFAQCSTFFEIGCGTGYVLSKLLKKFPNMHLAGCEYFSEGLVYTAQRVPNIEIFQMDARNIPFYEEFDVVGAFDMLEHILEDESVLANMYNSVKPSGGVIITVPQHKWLWSPQDEFACHVRRYASKNLRQKVTAAGFEVIDMISFVSLLLPVFMLSRLKKCLKNKSQLEEFQIPNGLNNVLDLVMRLEHSLIKMGVRIPIGSSLMCVAKKH